MKKVEVPVEIIKGVITALDEIDCDDCACTEECDHWCDKTTRSYCSELFKLISEKGD